MNRARRLQAGMIPGALLLGVSLVQACTNDFTSSNPDGSGGTVDSTSGGTNSYPCEATLVGAGGSVDLPNCDEWLGEGEGAPLNFACGQGGQSGDGGDGSGGDGGDGGDETSAEKPALQRVCEAPSNPDFSRAQPVFRCLDALTHSVCSANQEIDVRSCLTQRAPCDQDLDALGCTEILASCSALTASACYWAMTAARNPDVIAPCFAESRGNESCEDTFMHCAWGL